MTSRHSLLNEAACVEITLSYVWRGNQRVNNTVVQPTLNDAEMKIQKLSLIYTQRLIDLTKNV